MSLYEVERLMAGTENQRPIEFSESRPRPYSSAFSKLPLQVLKDGILRFGGQSHLQVFL